MKIMQPLTWFLFEVFVLYSLGRRFCNMFSESSPCLLGQHESSSTAQWPGELSENILQHLRNKLPPQTVEATNSEFSFIKIWP